MQEKNTEEFQKIVGCLENMVTNALKFKKKPRKHEAEDGKPPRKLVIA